MSSMSLVITNGVPKSGNHALAKAVQLLGHACEVDHQPWGEHWAMTTVPRIFLRRDPRNIVLSWATHQRLPHNAATVKRLLRSFVNGPSLVQEMAAYEGWLSDAGTLQVRYEDLVASDAEMRRIAAYLGEPYPEGSWEHLPGLTWSWTPNHADWRAVWTPRIERDWSDAGGDELLKRWGY